MTDDERSDARPVVVYDGACSFCRRQVERVSRWDVRGAFELAPRDTPGLESRFPELAKQEFNTGMRLVEEDGRIHIGADAVYEIARRLPGWRRIVWLYRVPVLHGLGRFVYAWIAARRSRLA